MIVLRYDGDKYPLPSDAETLPKETAITGTRIIADDPAADLEEGKGLYLSE